MQPGVAVITGAAGFLGRAFSAALLAGGWEVRGVDVRPGPHVTVGDVSRPGTWTTVLDGADVVLHAAAVASGDDATFWRVNVDGTRTTLTEAQRAGVRRVLHLSSTVVLGRDFPDGVDETAPVRMTGNPYTDTKVSAEHQALMTAATGGIEVTVLRPGEVYGPHATWWTVRPVELMRRNLFTLVDGGQGILSPVYVDDVVAAGLAALEAEAAAGEVFHVTGGAGVPASEFFGSYADMLGKRLRSLPGAALRTVSGPVGAIARSLGWQPPFSAGALEFMTHPGTYSIAKARDRLGWEPNVDLAEGMRRTHAWLVDAGLVPAEPPTADKGAEAADSDADESPAAGEHAPANRDAGEAD